ncbi:SusD/RagB family nutrient-binding outer membrane lipoprotein [Halosquirtibacter xylanolyticus]|uniref:SusD/RagB family nutrient-binding outer membrane lipoprotein n=1 Tax=Halosquirtibacter xylanolyticus TaxID=3374599 RepID=UPI00374980A3|nr:SusD/RagB family nutrient-binding outer membrane lipoprotein [Prolixibacteraceae bacterium]
MLKLRFNRYIVLFPIFLFLIGCGDQLTETNVNPNAPNRVPVTTLLIKSQNSLIHHLRDKSYAGRSALVWMQYWAQTNYTNEDRYVFDENTNASRWSQIYLDLMDLKEIEEINADPQQRLEAALYGDSDNQVAVARILKSWVFMVLTESYGPIPYYSYGNKSDDFQALGARNKVVNPIYADPQSVYLDILNELREAADMIHEDKIAFSSGDNIYQGDARKWKRLANSLILRGALRISKVLPEVATEAIQKALDSGVMQSNDDSAFFTSDAVAANASPFYRAFAIDNRSDFAVAKPFVDLLKGVSGPFAQVDPRLYYFAAPIEAVAFASSGPQIIHKSYIPSASDLLGSGTYQVDNYEGMPYGLESVFTSRIGIGATSLPNMPIQATFKNTIMGYSEVCLILSEWNGWDDAYYKRGVAASLDRWGVTASNINDYVALLSPANEERVLTQKYISLYMQPFNAWAEYRRTGYPKILVKPGEVSFVDEKGVLNEEGETVKGKSYIFTSLAPDVQDDLPRRLRYSNKESLLNPSGYKKGLALLNGPDLMSTDIWWDID